MNAAILGTGSWASAFGRHLAHKWDRVVLWGVVPEQVDVINTTGTNPDYLGDLLLPPNLRALDTPLKVVVPATAPPASPSSVCASRA